MKSLTLFILFFAVQKSMALDWPKGSAGEIEASTCMKEFPNPNFLKRPVDPSNPNSETFNFFYFSKNQFDKSKPTFLYIDGGPGQITGSYINKLRFTNLDHMNVIYFHPRGNGCSIFPASNIYDPFLRMQPTMTDLEALRNHLNIKSWDIIYGVSYGTTFGLKYLNEFGPVAKNIILESLFVPAYKDDDTQKLTLFFKKTMPTFLEIIKTWPDFINLNPASIKHIETQINNLYMGQDMVDLNLKPISLQEFVILGFPLMYHGPAQYDSFNRIFALYSVLDMLGLFINEAEIKNLNIDLKFSVTNRLPTQSMRSTFVIRAYDGLEKEYVDNFNKLGIENAIKNSPENPGLEFLFPFTDYQKNIEELNLSLDPSIQVITIQGDRDGVTFIEAVDDYYKNTDTIDVLIRMHSMGHSRHFTDECYKDIFSDVLNNNFSIKTFATGTTCEIKTGFDFLSKL